MRKSARSTPQTTIHQLFTPGLGIVERLGCRLVALTDDVQHHRCFYQGATRRSVADFVDMVN